MLFTDILLQDKNFLNIPQNGHRLVNKRGCDPVLDHSLYPIIIFTFSKQIFNESLDFRNRSKSHDKQKKWSTSTFITKITCKYNTL